MSISLKLSLLGLIAALGLIPSDGRGQSGSKTVAIVKDSDSWYFDGVIERVVSKLSEMAEGSYALEFQSLNGNSDADQIEALVRQALADETVDLIYVAGVVGTERTAAIAREGQTDPAQQFSKPVLIGALQFTDKDTLMMTENGMSDLPNVTFISNPRRIESDLNLLREVGGNLPTADVLIDERMLKEIVNLDEATAAVSEDIGAQLRLIAAPASVDATLAAIPSDTKALYVTISPQFNEEQRSQLYAGLAQRGIVTVSMLGVTDVRLGAMAGLASDLIGLGDDADSLTITPSTQALPQRTATNIHQMLLGVPTNTLPINLPVQDRLVINAETAETVGWSPTYELALKAEFINESVRYEGEALELDQAMMMAAANNADVRIANAGADIATQDARITASNRLPQVKLEGNHARVGFGDPIQSTTPDYAHEGTFGVQLAQVLFNDELRSNIAATRELAASAALDAESARLDAMEAAAVAYLDYLTATNLYEIEQANLNLTRNNLESARLRAEIGSATQSEIFRWEQRAAADLAALFTRDADRANALIELNRILGEPRDKLWSPVTVTMDNEDSLFIDEILIPLLDKQAENFERFGVFLKQFSVVQSPELLSFDRALEAQGILLGERRRSFFLPEVSGFANQNRITQGGQSISTDGQNETTLGVQFSYPIFEGGRRRAELEQKESEIVQLAAQREAAVQFIEQRAMVQFNAIGATHPNIRLSRFALEAAEKTYQAVQDEYAQGAADILDVLDAQNVLLSQRQQATIAVFQYAQEVYRLQRAIAWFEFEASEPATELFADQLTRFMAGEEVEFYEGDRVTTVEEPETPAATEPLTEVVVEPSEEAPSKRFRLFGNKKKKNQNP